LPLVYSRTLIFSGSKSEKSSSSGVSCFSVMVAALVALGWISSNSNIPFLLHRGGEFWDRDSVSSKRRGELMMRCIP
jgi:hypothetical protein